MMDWNDHGYGMNGGGIAIMLVLLLVLIALAVWTVTTMTRQHHTPLTTAESPRQILDRRFASGEVNAEQYAEARRVLEGRTVDTGPASG